MKALSMTQPWATLVAIGEKTIETRSWGTEYRGLIAIHAAKGFPNDAKLLCRMAPFMAALARGGIRAPGELPLGAVIAVAEVEWIRRTDDVRPHLEQHRVADELAFGDYSPGRWAWGLRNVAKLPEPIPARGMLSLWDLPADVAERIQREVR